MKAGGPLDSANGADWAQGWLDAIFRGGPLPQELSGGAHLSAIAAALREALSIFSLGMLVIAGILLAYHVTAMIAETAHTGVPMGRRANRLWAPIRLALAIGLLVPVGGGLNSGQYLIVKLAGAGSSLASNAWRGAVDSIKGSLNTFAQPYRPDAARLTAVALEMEICRTIYRQLFAAAVSDTSVMRAGNIFDLQKLPSGRMAPETWRYTNALHASLPLCGEYRFRSDPAASGAATDDLGKFTGELAALARADAERLSLQTRALAERIAPAFLPPASGASSPANEVSGALAVLVREQQKTLDAALSAMAAGKTQVIDRALDESASAGWVAAGFFVGEIARRQSAIGAMATSAIPSAHSPLFGHKALDHAVFADATGADPVLRLASQTQLDKVFSLYEQTNAAMKRARGWLYGKALSGQEPVLADVMDMRDQTGPANDAEDGPFMFARLLSAAASAYGVWAGDGTANASGHDIANPVARLAELGRRYAALGNYLLAMSGPGLAEPNLLGSVLLFAITGFAFSLAGMMMIFVLPLLPFVRFFLGVMAWLLAVFEAVAALPLVALAHLTPAGEGLSGPVARRAYWLWLGVFMRPLLTLLGFAAGFVFLALALSLLNVLYGPLVNPLAAYGNELIFVWAGFALLYSVIALAIMNAAFKSINWLPARILGWLGGWSLQGGGEADAITAGPSSAIAAPSTAAGALAAPGASITQSHVSGTAAPGEETGHAAYAAGARTSHGLKSALIPAYREAPAAAVVIAGEETSISAQGSEAAAGGAGAAAAASGTVATATATATAHAVATSRQIPASERPTPEEIQKALERFALKPERRSGPPEKSEGGASGKPAPEGTAKKPVKRDESPEQSSAPPETDKPK